MANQQDVGTKNKLMDKIRFSLLVFCLLLAAGCRRNAPVAPSPATQTPTGATDSANAKEYVPDFKVQNGYVTVKDGNVSFVYKADDYARIVVTRDEKFVDPEPTPSGNYPEYRCFNLEDKRPLPALEKGGRYYFPARSEICILPLSDATEKDFAKSYPEITAGVNKLRQVLSKRSALPASSKELPDLPLNNAGRSFNSKIQFQDFQSGAGFLLLTQYTQERESNPLNNEELTCLFQGVTNDGKHYVSARMAITHPSLPQGIDFTNHIKRDSAGRYLKAGEQRLNTLADESFQPSLTELKKLFASISIE